MHTAAVMLILVVRTYNLLNVPTRELDVARHVSRNILQRAGIETIWIDCPGATSSPVTLRTCTDTLQSDEVMLRILRAPGRQSEGAATDALGDSYIDIAEERGSLATVYVDRIAAMAGASSLDLGTLLGRVMAHEIGHLLLGSTAHQPQGIMRATWSPSLLQRRFARDWQFSRDEVERLDKNLSLRMENRALSPEVYQPTSFPLSCSSSQVLSGAK